MVEAGKGEESETSSSTSEQGVVYYLIEYVLPLNIILLTLLLLVLFFYLGPVAVFKFILSFLPKNPGLTHALFLGGAIVISIVLPTPLWPPLMIVTAMVFGFWKGFAISYCAMVLGAIISFGIGRYFMMQPFRDYIESSDYVKFKRMISVVEAEGNSFKFTFLFRFLYMPIWIRNYVPSLLQVYFWHFMVSVLAHSVWICLVFASAGTASRDMSEVIAEGQNPWKKVETDKLMVFGVAMTATCLLSYFAYREYMLKLEEEDATTALLPNRA